ILSRYADGRQEDGIEAWLHWWNRGTIEEEVMTKFEIDPFLQRPVGMGRFDSIGSNLAHQSAQFHQVVNFHT
ncbi:hypothetical protein GBA52_013538, partial [Prunus armeniaca]